MTQRVGGTGRRDPVALKLCCLQRGYREGQSTAETREEEPGSESGRTF